MSLDAKKCCGCVAIAHRWPRHDSAAPSMMIVATPWSGASCFRCPASQAARCANLIRTRAVSSRSPYCETFASFDSTARLGLDRAPPRFDLTLGHQRFVGCQFWFHAIFDKPQLAIFICIFRSRPLIVCVCGHTKTNRITRRPAPGGPSMKEAETSGARRLIAANDYKRGFAVPAIWIVVAMIGGIFQHRGTA